LNFDHYTAAPACEAALLKPPRYMNHHGPLALQSITPPKHLSDEHLLLLCELQIQRSECITIMSQSTTIAARCSQKVLTFTGMCATTSQAKALLLLLLV
jgi:hypothetical protein